MLQQTQVSRVVPKYREFLRTYPTLDSIASSTPTRVCEAWEGLGYYARARSLHKLAVTVAGDARSRAVAGDGNLRATRRRARVRNGAKAPARAARPCLPDDPAELRTLPGIGAYTAGAVATFAFERRAPIVDTNVARVLRRVFAPHLAPKTPATHRTLWSLAEASLPRTGKAAWTHNQALIELGALVCKPRAPRCGECPVNKDCITNVSGIQSN